MNSDINNKEREELYLPYGENITNYMREYIVPEAFAFQLANAHSRDYLGSATLEQHCNLEYLFIKN